MSKSNFSFSKNINENWRIPFFLLPLALFCIFILYKSKDHSLHDFSNSYFPAHLAVSNTPPEDTVFDIYKFNKYAWDNGYSEVLIDFYLNSPFTSTAFYPFALIDNAYTSKLIFSSISIVLFLISIHLLAKKFVLGHEEILCLLPILFYIPIRNHILFGQSYMLVFFLVVVGFYVIDKNKWIVGSTFLSLAALIKIFPIFYFLPLLLTNKRKVAFYIFFSTLGFVSISIYTSGFSFWYTYLFDVLPNSIINESTVDYHFSAQSITVFLKNIFIKDEYYNPSGLINSYWLYKLIGWVLKSIIIGLAIQLTIKFKDEIFKVLAIWVVALFLLQTRTATYAQILWIIPSFIIYNSPFSKQLKLLFFGILLFVCNFPFHWLSNIPIGIRFLRMWLSLVLGLIFFHGLEKKVNFKFILATFILLTPLHLKIFNQISQNPNSFPSEYILAKKNAFIVYDFGKSKGELFYKILGSNGNETIQTDIPIYSYDSVSCSIQSNQIFYNGQQLTDNHALKKKPVLINNCDLYYLTDHHGRRAAYTIKKINVCK